MLGLARADPNNEEGYDGLLGYSLGMAWGLQYNPKKPGKCYNAVSDVIFDFDNILNILSQIYIPSNWAVLISAAQDQFKSIASLTANCDLQKFFNTVTALFTLEGVSKLAARLAGGAVFELPKYYDEYLAASTAFDSGKPLGKMTQLFQVPSILHFSSIITATTNRKST